MSITLFTRGDIVNFTVKKDFIHNKLTQIIKSSDISICNFEAPIEHQNMKPINKAGRPHVYQSEESIEYLKNAGFNCVSLANNHIYENRSKENRNLLLLHNIRIDTHRFVVQRALSLLSEGRNL